MNVSVDKNTGIVGLGLTQEEAASAMRFYIERSGKLSQQRIARKKEMHAWLPKPNILHIKGVGAVIFNGGYFTNLKTGKQVKALIKPLAHYLCLYNVFDGDISYEDFTLTLGDVINRYMLGLSSMYMTLHDFPYVVPVESMTIKHYHETILDGVTVIESADNKIVISDNKRVYEVEKTIGVSDDCLMAYLFAHMGFMFDGENLRRV